ncbi:MAG: radical SAM protein, partial [Leptospirales bacterium]|nr:radical SAM protein [Leptospirales bacterium]
CRAESQDIDYDGELGFKDITRVIDDITVVSKPILVLTGGEPLYRSDIFDIASYAVSKGLRTALATNGTLVDKKIAQSIRAAGISRVSISIDGSDARTHDEFRGIPGSFDKAVQGAQFLKDEGVDFQFNVTITKRNIDQIDGILDFAVKSKAAALHIFMLVPVGCGVSIADTEMISAEKYEDVLNWFYERSKNVQLEFKATCAPHYYRLIRQRAGAEGRTLTMEQDGMAAMTRGCLAGSGVCFISHSGDVQPCGYLPLVAGNVLSTPFEEIWEKSELFISLRKPNLLAGKCGACTYRAVCGGCRARAHYATGGYLDEEPYCVHEP